MRFLAVILCLVFLAGCAATTPRYRKGGREVQKDNSEKQEKHFLKEHKTSDFDKLQSNDLLRLGRIIQSYLGTPYSGHSPFVKGLDCSQFVRNVFRTFNNTELPRTSKEQFKMGHKITRGHLRYGDLVFYKTNGKSISHVGIYIGYGEFVHASSSSGVIISRIDEEYWRKRYVGARRIID